MPKMKTKSSAAKRYTITGKGHVKVGHKGKQHLFSNKSRKRKRNLRGSMIIADVDEKMAKSLLPYG